VGNVQEFEAASDRPAALVLRALKLGDLLVAVPALHAVRRALPEHRLVLAVPGWLDEMVDLVDGVDALLPTPGLDDPLPLAPGTIDTAINMHGNGPESRGMLDAIRPARRLGHRFDASDPSLTWQGPEWIDGIHERVRWARLVEAHGMPADPDEVWIRHPGPSERRGAVVVHVGAFYGSRHWPVDRFAAVGAALRDDGHDVVFTGSDRERQRAVQVARLGGFAEDHVLAGRLGLRAFASLVADARIVISADTGAAHVASALRVPSVVIFGPAPAEEWGPPPGPHVVLTDARLRRGAVFVDDPDPALLAVSVEDVLTAARDLLS